jgi:hypothetical protein
MRKLKFMAFCNFPKITLVLQVQLDSDLSLMFSSLLYTKSEPVSPSGPENQSDSQRISFGVCNTICKTGWF